MSKSVFSDFTKWLDAILSTELPKNIQAFCFNIYEGKDTFHIQLIGASSFSEKTLIGLAMKLFLQKKIFLWLTDNFLVKNGKKVWNFPKN